MKMPHEINIDFGMAMRQQIKEKSPGRRIALLLMRYVDNIDALNESGGQKHDIDNYHAILFRLRERASISLAKHKIINSINGTTISY